MLMAHALLLWTLGMWPACDCQAPRRITTCTNDERMERGKTALQKELDKLRPHQELGPLRVVPIPPEHPAKASNIMI